MKYMTDAHLAGLAKELKDRGIDCETVHQLMMESADSSKTITDPKIFKFLKEERETITLITMDIELAQYCEDDGIPCVRVQDVVAEHIRKTKPSGSES